MTAALPSPRTTLVILLGASEWPFSPEFQDSKAFLNSAMGLREYFRNPSQFGLPFENLLDLFDSNQSSDDIDGEIGLFIEKRTAEMKQAGEVARDLLVYFVGHGGFVGNDSDFYLAIRRTRTDNPSVSGIRMLSLAYTLKEKARYLRRIVILDCCFAGAAFVAFQSGPAQTAILQTIDAFKVQGKGTDVPERGTSLLCSSRHNAPSLISQDGTYTMFSKALLRALSTGDPRRQDSLSLQEIADLTKDVLNIYTMPEKSVPRPEVHSPDQVDGNVANVPFFPNPRIEEERRRRAEEEQVRKAEEERVRKVKEERARLAEEERRRQAEEEYARKEEEEQLRRAEEERTRRAEEEARAYRAEEERARGKPQLPIGKRSISRRSVLVVLAGIAVAGGGLLWLTRSQQPSVPAALTSPTTPPTSLSVISDAAHVFGDQSQSQVKNEAATLPNPISIYTTSTFNGTNQEFDQQTRSHITNPNMIVMAIDTTHHHLAIAGGSNVPLSNSQYQDAVQSFKDNFGSGDYTGATIAAIQRLRNDLGAAPVSNGNNSGVTVPTSSGGGFFSSLLFPLCCVGVIILVIVGVLFTV